MAVEKGNTVKIEYEGRLEDGTVFDASSKHDKLLEFKVGDSQVIPGFENAVLGMEKGQEKEVTITPEQAYGMPNEELKKKIPRDKLPAEQEPQVGMTLLMTTPQGQMPVTIVEVGKEDVTIDLNHPLAGKTLIFKIKVAEVSA